MRIKSGLTYGEVEGMWLSKRAMVQPSVMPMRTYEGQGQLTLRNPRMSQKVG
ncbi:hypothetical protein M0D69_35220 [Caballeronia sp. SEWSISQ10-4 2]|uniref:hypothetical protein n=1 Tax=Caballeronia sp. SEWSISQ10-4 2 TaxID=2937438 RepID=UPI0026544920|nr:hypothetical protein [Caballeronia sp. SEWSISQ10-4 2]MDN7183173.1 hypothetical protein [Caballeronia sp. SEWSISQ10-4 2]